MSHRKYALLKLLNFSMLFDVNAAQVTMLEAVF